MTKKFSGKFPEFLRRMQKETGLYPYEIKAILRDYIGTRPLRMKKGEIFSFANMIVAKPTTRFFKKSDEKELLKEYEINKNRAYKGNNLRKEKELKKINKRRIEKGFKPIDKLPSCHKLNKFEWEPKKKEFIELKNKGY